MQQAADAIGMSFDANQWQPNQGGGPRNLPIGKHPVVITGGGLKTTNDKMSGYLELDVRVIDGQFTNATGVMRYNLHNKSKKAKEIAHEKFSALCHVLGVYRVDVVSQIANKPFIVEVQPQAENPQFTEVTTVFDINGNLPKQGGVPQQAPPQQMPPQGGPNGAAPQWAAQVVGQPVNQAPPPQMPPQQQQMNQAPPAPPQQAYQGAPHQQAQGYQQPPQAPPQQQMPPQQAQWDQAQAQAASGPPVWDQPPQANQGWTPPQ